MRSKSNVIKRNVEKIWGARYLPKNTYTFTITLLCLNPLHVLGIKRPYSGGTTLAFLVRVSCTVAVGWLQDVGRLTISQQLQCTQLIPKIASVVPPEDGRLTPETCRGLRHNKVIVKVKVY
jgi:hypothetical protein